MAIGPKEQRVLDWLEYTSVGKMVTVSVGTLIIMSIIIGIPMLLFSVAG